MPQFAAPRPPDNRPPGRPRRDLALDEPPTVVDGDVVRVIEIDSYPVALIGIAGCTGVRGHYITDPVEIAAIARRTESAANAALALTVVKYLAVLAALCLVVAPLAGPLHFMPVLISLALTGTALLFVAVRCGGWPV